MLKYFLETKPLRNSGYHLVDIPTTACVLVVPSVLCVTLTWIVSGAFVAWRKFQNLQYCPHHYSDSDCLNRFNGSSQVNARESRLVRKHAACRAQDSVRDSVSGESSHQSCFVLSERLLGVRECEIVLAVMSSEDTQVYFLLTRAQSNVRETKQSLG